jgi:hypothetical protein
MDAAGKALLVVGAVLVLAGILIVAASRLGLGSLPGSFVWRRGNTTIYAPIGLMLLISVILTLIANLRR